MRYCCTASPCITSLVMDYTTELDHGFSAFGRAEGTEALRLASSSVALDFPPPEC